MTTRHAACSCGQLHLTIEGDPVRISMCHCFECQRRTGAVLSNQARFAREQITLSGAATEWTRTAASGNGLTFRFCPVCGSTVYWTGEGFPGYVAVAIGAFADPTFPAPTIAVWEECRHPWVTCRPTPRPSARRSRGDDVSAQLGYGESSSLMRAVIPPLWRLIGPNLLMLFSQRSELPILDATSSLFLIAGSLLSSILSSWTHAEKPRSRSI